MVTIEQLYEVYLKCPNIAIDTRRINNETIFFALKGPHFDANLFVDEAFKNGASYVVVDNPNVVINDKCLLVEDVLTALQKLAEYHRKKLSIPIIAITGSNGKTTTKELANVVLSKKFKTYATVGNLNNHIGVPLTLLAIKNDAQIAIVEMGANHLNEIASYCQIAHPTIGVITNCGKAHIEGFGSEEGVRKGKGELFDYLKQYNGLVFINSDLGYLKDMSMGMKEVFTYGTVNAKVVGKCLQSSLFLDMQVFISNEDFEINTNLVGAYNLPNVLLAVSIGTYFSISYNDIKDAIESYTPDNSRSQLVQKGTNQIIYDAYNANPSSMQVAIQNFSKITAQHKILWLGAMKEMGHDELLEHQNLIAYLKQWAWESVLLVGKEFEPVKGDFIWFEDTQKAAKYVAQHLPQNAAILIKGSRGSKMELLYDCL